MNDYNAETEVDHYKFWEIEPQTFGRGVKLEGQFDDKKPIQQQLEQLTWIANPAEKEFNGKIHPITRPVAHLLGYFFTPADQQPARWVLIKNQLSTKQVVWTLGNPTMLLLPASKVHTGNPPAPPNDVDHFECYLVTKAASVAGPVVIEDQFDKNIIKKKEKLSTLEPAFFCVPVSKNGGAIIHKKAHLALYDIAQQDRTSLQKIGKVIKVSCRDQFKVWNVDVKESIMIGVPTEKKNWGEGEPPKDLVPPDDGDDPT
jgi:hypothetical protein